MFLNVLGQWWWNIASGGCKEAKEGWRGRVWRVEVGLTGQFLELLDTKSRQARHTGHTDRVIVRLYLM